MTGCTSATVTPASRRLNNRSPLGLDGHALPLNLTLGTGQSKHFLLGSYVPQDGAVVRAVTTIGIAVTRAPIRACVFSAAT